MSATVERNSTPPGATTEAENETAADVAVLAPSDCPRATQTAQNYSVAINDLARDAKKNRRTEDFVTALCWTLARVIVHYDSPRVTGDVLKRVGDHMSYLGELRKAEQEAGKSKEEGHVPH